MSVCVCACRTKNFCRCIFVIANAANVARTLGAAPMPERTNSMPIHFATCDDAAADADATTPATVHTKPTREVTLRIWWEGE